MAKVIGLGGVFIKHNDPKVMKEWYTKVLGLKANDYGILFHFNQQQGEKKYLQLSFFEEKTAYFGNESQQFMLNLRVDNLEELIPILKQNKVEIVDEMEVYEYGKFLHINDPEGIRIELWEAIDSAFNDEISNEMQ